MQKIDKRRGENLCVEGGKIWAISETPRLLDTIEIKPCGIGSRIRDVEAFCYKTEIKIIYFVPLCLIVSDCMVYPDPTLFT